MGGWAGRQAVWLLLNGSSRLPDSALIMPFVVLNKIIKVISLLRLLVMAKEGVEDGDFSVTFAGYVKVTNI